MEPWIPLIVFHAFFAAVALPLGAFQLLRRRRGDRWHVLIGRVWAISIVLTSVPSFWIGDYSTFLALFLKFLAVVSIVSVIIGWRAAQRGDMKNHAGFMTGAYLGLVSAFIGVVAPPNPHGLPRSPGRGLLRRRHRPCDHGGNPPRHPPCGETEGDSTESGAGALFLISWKGECAT